VRIFTADIINCLSIRHPHCSAASKLLQLFFCHTVLLLLNSFHSSFALVFKAHRTM
jgi:hypothetical protein